MQDNKTFSDSTDYDAGLSKIFNTIQELELAIKTTDREQFIEQAINILLQDFDIKPDTPVTDQLILDVCRDHVFFVPELLGADVPTVQVKGYQYKSMPNLTLETCPSPLTFKADRESMDQTESI